MWNRGSTLSARRYLRTVFLERPVRRAISRIEKPSRWRQRRMTLNNSIWKNSRFPGQLSVEINNLLPQPAIAPRVEAVLHGGERREALRQQPPGTSGTDQVEQ